MDTEVQSSILILEAEDITKALDILNEGFTFNRIKHPNLLNFLGCYMNEVAFQSNFLQEIDEEDSATGSSSLLDLKAISNLSGGITY